MKKFSLEECLMSRPLWRLALMALVLSIPALPGPLPLYTVTLDTGVLNPSQTWALDFQLAASDLPSENSVSLSNIHVSGGALGAANVLSGDVTGNAATGFTLTDPADLNTAFLSELLIYFTPGSTVSFDLGYTDLFSGDPTATPDTFTWAVLDSNFDSIVSTGLQTSLLRSLDGSGTIPEGFAADGAFNFVTPVIIPFSTPISAPEPGAWTLLLLGAACCYAGRRRKSI